MPKISFTKKEVRELLLSSVIVGFALHLFWKFETGNAIANLFLAILAGGLTYVVHELGHKIFAQKYECIAEYRIIPKWAVASIIVSMFCYISGFPVLFIAVGAVFISTKYETRLGYRFVQLTREENGKIAMAGSVANIMLAILLNFFRGFSPIVGDVVTLNLVIALFNTLPIPPLDGTKIFAWDLVPGVLLLVTEIALLLTVWWMPLGYILLIVCLLWVVLFLWMQKYTKISI